MQWYMLDIGTCNIQYGEMYIKIKVKKMRN